MALLRAIHTICFALVAHMVLTTNIDAICLSHNIYMPHETKHTVSMTKFGGLRGRLLFGVPQHRLTYSAPGQSLCMARALCTKIYVTCLICPTKISALDVFAICAKSAHNAL